MFSMDDYLRRQTILKELLDSGDLVNCKLLTSDGGVFDVHLEVVAGKSPYIKGVMFGASREMPLREILIPGISKDVLANIVHFMYTGKLELSQDKIEELAQAGKFLGLQDVLRFCKRFLASNLDDESCIAIYNFAKSHYYDDLKNQARSYILRRFQHVFPVSSDYLDLQENDLVEFLSSDGLSTSGEEYVFWAIMRWVEKDPAARSGQCLARLLRCVRFGLCTKEFYERNVSSHPYMLSSEDCQSVVLQASQLYEDIQQGQQSDNDIPNRLRSTMLDVRHPFLRPRTPDEIVFVMGGWSAGSATNVIETFDIRSGRWFLSLSTDSIPRAYHGMLWHRGYIYVIGGFDGNQCFNTVRRYDPVTHAWEEKGCMHEQRCYVSVAAVEGHIYAMGGYDGHRRNKSCERFDPEMNQWDVMAPMNQVRSDASADTLNGKVYIAGGFNGQQVLNSAECYDPSSNVWTAITVMRGPRSGVKLVAYSGHLYIIGGFNGNSRLSTVDKYDPQTNSWSPVTSMNTPRSNFATALLYDCLYVIGGFNGFSTISGVERYDSLKNTWQPMTELNLNRSALAACTVKGISNPEDYTFLGNAAFT